VLNQGGEEGSFVVVSQACSPWVVGCPGQLPAERAGESLLQRPRAEPDPSCLAAVSGVEAPATRGRRARAEGTAPLAA
jgi:hypothetical protein